MANRESRRVRHSECNSCAPGGCSGNQVQGEHTLEGWRLICAAIAVFVLPWVLAVLGAVCGGFLAVGQWVGAVVGLTAGMLAVWSAARFLESGARKGCEPDWRHGQVGHGPFSCSARDDSCRGTSGRS